MLSQQVEAVILCGGLGTRLRPAVGASPKAMAEVNQRPFLDVLIQEIQAQGVRRVILCTGYKAEAIERYYQQQDFGLSIDFSREAQPLGTGGALKQVVGMLRDRPFLVLNGDSYCPVDLSALLDFHLTRQARATLVVSRVQDTCDYGRVLLDASGAITAFEEKAAGRPLQDEGLGYVNAGVYCFSQQVFAWLPLADQFSLEKEVFPSWIGQSLYGFKTAQPFWDIGTPSRYAAIKEMLERKSHRDD